MNPIENIIGNAWGRTWAVSLKFLHLKQNMKDYTYTFFPFRLDTEMYSSCQKMKILLY